MKAIYKTDCGKVRANNEDHVDVFQNDAILLAVVADGMGGEKAGEVASGLALRQFSEAWATADNGSHIERPEDWLRQCIIDANQSIYNFAKANPECQGMGTTIVAAICTKESVIVAHVGDSRAYYVNRNGELRQVTEDHSLVNQLVKAGQLSEADAHDHPMKHVIVRACGTDENISVDVSSIEWSKGEQLLLCSDGLSDMLNDGEIASLLNRDETIEEKARLLIDKANTAGGHDNITLIIVLNDDGEEL
ncbi:Stp1/IreP family PP2C-type Ser/Thr phosphatase [Tuberibacillus calidus]|jgi:protein phosphatase|uniref:Stp1/IreP family PP2C-type Ser/Thr phosphatase n=1 Tax=Tuberibacillus calidus TaxID=340097 RepID=UPI00040334EF|nr:Stp1/IreP family PP2C-type Ser/Thr phosphatase [Tuberibacillus calidus]